ncbi:MAG: ROK family glucokinase [Lachnospiraceae bacterium]|nr:ROK family glucokinase [Lachnospiraceae bacterium]
MYAIGIDVGGTSVKIGLFTDDGNMAEKWSIPTRVENNGKDILPDIALSVLQKIKDRQIPIKELKGVGVGLPGPVDSHGVIRKAVNLHWPDTFNVEEKLSHYLGGITEVKAANDANVAALGEAWVGSGKGCGSVVMVTLGTGIGGGIIINGHILAGFTGSGGEIGHTFVQEGETEICNCGKTGCLEQYASATGVVRLLRRELEAYPDTQSSLRYGEPDAKAIWDAVKAGDSLAIKVAEKFGYYLGSSLANLASIVNPELIIIGGGMSLAGDVLIPYVRKNFEKYVFHASMDTRFALATLGNDGGMYGAARLVLA